VEVKNALKLLRVILSGAASSADLGGSSNDWIEYFYPGPKRGKVPCEQLLDMG
jgi:hypothetical protein